MATLKGRAQHRLFAAKKRVQIAPLSVGDVNAIAFTVLRGSSSTLLRTATESKAGRAQHPDPRVFANAITSVVNHRKGSLYASLVTSIDTRGVFHPEQFATSVARLGVVDDIKSKLSAENYGTLGDLIATRAPFFWADMISSEITIVRKEVSSFMGRLFAKFHESVDTDTADELLEFALHDAALVAMSPKAQLMRGALNLDVAGSTDQALLSVFRRLSQTQRMGLLNPNSSLEATFETFHQHLMTNPVALQKLIPRAKFGGKLIPPNKLQRLFRDQQLVRRLRAAFKDAYDKPRHDVQIDRLYRSMKRLNVQGEIARAGRTLLNMKLSEDSISAIVSGIVGLFFAFAGDTKGTRFPQMKSIKG